MKPDTLLIVTSSFPDRGDGSEAAGAFVEDIARELGRWIPVRVVAPGRVPGEVNDGDGFQVRRFASPGKPLSLLSPMSPKDWPAIAQVLMSLRREALAAASDGRVAHVLALWALPSGWAARTIESRLGIPYSTWVLGSDIWSLGKLPLVRSLLRRILLDSRRRFADGMLLGADAGRIAGADFEFLSSARSLDLPARHAPRAKPPYELLYLGRWHPNKGIDLLLDALEALDDDAWSKISTMHIAGGGLLEPLVHAKVRALLAEGRPVRLSGYLGREQAAAALCQADYLVIPSRVESIPVVFSDALQAGCAIVSTPVGDLPDLFGADPPGILAGAADADSLAQALRHALDSPPASFAAAVEGLRGRFSVRDNIAPRLRALVDS